MSGEGETDWDDALSDHGDAPGGGGADRVLNQDEIDSLLGFGVGLADVLDLLIRLGDEGLLLGDQFGQLLV